MPVEVEQPVYRLRSDRNKAPNDATGPKYKAACEYKGGKFVVLKGSKVTKIVNEI